MALTGTDAFGTFIDTGSGTTATPRANIEVEVHTAADIDSGSKLVPTVNLHPSHIPHRDKNNPR